MIAVAKTDDEIQNCYAVMAELRPHIKPDEFLPQVKRQAENSGYQLVYLTDSEVKAVGGFRISEWLSGGKYLEIEDLVAKSGDRSKGYGGALFDWLIEHAKENNCHQVKLVSHVKRFGAHRFYLQKRMDIEAHYFSLNLKS
ncbi:MAG: GNAT family N-acetyltransferase [Pyrinomonadaceae bacterium]|nr:GNAT family N-acetyltransferase [Pyrinomonadaceae bacterium]